jgi:hypothetical protein
MPPTFVGRTPASAADPPVGYSDFVETSTSRARAPGAGQGTRPTVTINVVARLVRIMWVPLLLSVLYTGWVFWQRRTAGPSSNASRVERDPLAAYGARVKILHFYTTTREIAPGGKADVCYSVINATSLRLDPPVERVWPAVSRCFEVTPAMSTRYTLTAEDGKHNTVSESLEIAVKQ